MYARSTTIQAQPLSVDIGIAHVRDVVMPALQEMNGYVGLSLLVDRQSGRCIATSAWQTEQAMRDSEGPISAFRAMAMFRGRAGPQQVSPGRAHHLLPCLVCSL